MIKYEDVKTITTEEYFNYNKFSIDVFKKKYALNANESYVDAVWRVCQTVAAMESTPELSQYWAERWFDEIYNDKWHPAGSIMQGAGSDAKISLSNCTTIGLPDDSLEAILRYTGYRVQKTAAYRQGLGVSFSKLRPKSMAVNNSSKISSGSTHWMGFIDSFAYYVGQHGRIPAFLFSLDCKHLDVEDFIKLKVDRIKVQNANISVHMYNDLYEQAKVDGDWTLEFTVPEIKKGEKIYLDPRWDDIRLADGEDAVGYYTLAKFHRPAEHMEKIVKARYLIELIAKNMHNAAEPGVQNIDIARKYSNSDAVGFPIISTNAPVIGSTLIPTSEGLIPIKELYAKNSEVGLLYNNVILDDNPVCKYGKTNAVVGTFKKYENQQVYTIKFTNTKEISCNAEHKWFTQRGFVNAKNLIASDKIFTTTSGIVDTYNKPIKADSDDFKLGQLFGFVTGDGFIVKPSKSHKKIVGIVYNKEDIYYSDLFKSMYKKITNSDLSYDRLRGGCNENRTEHHAVVSFFEKNGYMLNKYVIPEACYTNYNIAAGFLQGLFDADGYVVLSSKKAARIILTSVHKELITKVHDLLLNTFGIFSIIKCTENVKGVPYGTNKISNAQKRYDLNINRLTDLIKFHKYINFNSKRKLEKLQSIIDYSNTTTKARKNNPYYIVKEVVSTTAREDMYCANIPDVHSFVANGLVSSNCSEQYLEDQGLCVLSSINAETVSFEELETISESIQRFLDNVVSLELADGRYATYEQKRNLENLRRIGAGITNLAALLFKNNLFYGSEEANTLIEKYIDSYNYYLYKYSIKVGKEKGSFKAFDKQKYLTSQFIIELLERHPDLEFNTMRNVCVTSIAPTGSLSLMFRGAVLSYGIEPAFGLYYWKRTRISGQYEYYFVVPSIVRQVLEQKYGVILPMQSDTIKDDWYGTHGMPIAKIISQAVKDFNISFKTADEVYYLEKLNLMARVQKCVDSSISVTYQLKEDSSWEDTYDLIMKAYEKKLKSIAAFRVAQMYGIVSEIPFRALVTKLTNNKIKIHPSNFNSTEAQELNITVQTDEIKFHKNAPKRPKRMPTDLYILTVGGTKFIVSIGLLNNEPYEIFCGELNDLDFKFREQKGTLEKVKRGQYKLEIGDSIVINDFAAHFKAVEKTLFRMVSTSLRHGVPIKFIVDQLQKSTDNMSTLTAAATRVLKKYIKNGEVATGQTCPSCGSADLIYEEGCVSCIHCGWSKCS